MSVFFRTGGRSGVSFSWWFYLLVVLPMQLLYAFAKAIVYAAMFAGMALIATGRFARDRWNSRSVG